MVNCNTGRNTRPRVYFKIKDCAREIVSALVNAEEHPTLTLRGGKIVINRSEIFEITSGYEETIRYRSRKLGRYIQDMMKAYPEYEEARYRNMLAYKPRNVALPEDSSSLAD
jgi:hypothetical protein